MGWSLRDYRGHKIVSHDGGLAAMTSRALLVPDLKYDTFVARWRTAHIEDADVTFSRLFVPAP